MSLFHSRLTVFGILILIQLSLLKCCPAFQHSLLIKKNVPRIGLNNGLLKASAEGDLDFNGIVEVERTYSDDGGENTTTKHDIKYHIHNRIRLSSLQAAPILVLHGGPGIPSDYLHPLTKVVPYRSIVFYDQLGCGRSPGPMSPEAYSLEKCVDDLELVIKKVGLRRFHLYGQSFGGILAFEYMKRVAEKMKISDDDPECLSVILSSSPCDVEQVESVADSLISDLLKIDDDSSTVMERFRTKHQCQTEEMPKPLSDAYERAGEPGIWRGTKSIEGWKAVKPKDGSKRMPSCMILRGENDFVTNECIKGWKDAFNHKFLREKVLDGCSHHGLLEDGNRYGEMIDSYFAEYD